MSKKPEVLPYVPSALLEIALDDMAALRQTGKVKFDMDGWLYNQPQKKTCVVCMAGAVMLRRGLVTEEIVADSAEYGPDDCRQNSDQLQMINEMRTGHFRAALEYCDKDLSAEQSSEVSDLEIHFWKAQLWVGASKGGLYPEEMYREAVQRLRRIGL